jgi:hypothetical protein
MPYRIDTLEALYRRFRADQNDGLLSGHRYSHPVGAAVTALRLAHEEQDLQRAEREDRIRFVWEYEYDWDIDNLETEEPWRTKTLEKLQSGEWEVLWCRAETPTRTCPHCGQTMPDDHDSDWETAGSLGGIVVDVGDENDYRREVERELADEAGVI